MALQSKQNCNVRMAVPALELLYLIQGIVVCGHPGVVDGAESDYHWVPDAGLQVDITR